ncbi:MAG: SET domain-containing protein-lysine N-methyltransferase [Elusimicrobiaceae bacterium]|nr:SET domain-containing protein-lysine N-methyltransferase [Elusimicrobiaceae bacterium]
MEKFKLENNRFGKALVVLAPIKKDELLFTDTGIISAVQTKYSYQVDWNLHCEPDGPSAYLNHSCSPNVGIRVKKGGHPSFFALREIGPGEVLAIDYATFEYRTKVLCETRCLCGSDGCREVIRGFVDLTRAQADAYGDYLADYLLDSKKELQ